MLEVPALLLLAYAYCFRTSPHQRFPKAQDLQKAMLSYMLAYSKIVFFILC